MRKDDELPVTYQQPGWEYLFFASDVGDDLSRLLEQPRVDDRTDWQNIQKLGMLGWEMVSTTPIVRGGSTTKLLWVFKRRV